MQESTNLVGSSPPEKEKQFQELKAKHGSFYAFHGSGFGNWHSILRVGLKNYSGTDLMSTGKSLTDVLSQWVGQAYGAGIYLSPSSSTSLGYARVGSVRCIQFRVTIRVGTKACLVDTIYNVCVYAKVGQKPIPFKPRQLSTMATKQILIT